MYCQQCGHELGDDVQFCPQCGAVVVTGKVSADPRSATMTLDGPGISEEDYLAAIGQGNQAYYLDRFGLFDREGIRVTWNWPCFFVTLPWFLYRKMWGWAGFYLIASIVLFYVTFVLTEAGLNIFAGVVNFLTLVSIYLLLPMFANALYYRQVRNQINRVKKQTGSREGQLHALSLRGGTSQAAVITMVILQLVGFSGILAAVALPAYHDYTTRAYVASALSTAFLYKPLVEDYAIKHNAWPTSLEDLGATYKNSNPVVEVLRVEEGGGIYFSFKKPEVLRNTAIGLIPSVDDSGYIVWECVASEALESKYLPAMCR